MTNPNFQPPSMIPYKSAAIALILTVFMGPVGLLYASFWGGFLMIFLGIIVISNKYIFPIILLWLMCCIWSVRAVENHNKKLFKWLNPR